MATVVDKNLSDFLRGSGPILDEVERHDVVLRRRDGEDLLLTEKRREEGIRGVFQLLAALAQSVVLKQLSGADIVNETLDLSAPWARVMPRKEQQRFVAEVAEAARSCEGLQTFEPLVRLIEDWKATAWVYAHPEVLSRLETEPDAEEARAVVPRPAV